MSYAGSAIGSSMIFKWQIKVAKGLDRGIHNYQKH